MNMADMFESRDPSYTYPIQSESRSWKAPHAELRVKITRLSSETTQFSPVCISKTKAGSQSQPDKLIGQQPSGQGQSQGQGQTPSKFPKHRPIILRRVTPRKDSVISKNGGMRASGPSSVTSQQVLEAVRNTFQILQDIDVPAQTQNNQTSGSCSDVPPKWETVAKPPSWKSPQRGKTKTKCVSESKDAFNKPCSSVLASAHPQSLCVVSTDETSPGHVCTWPGDQLKGLNTGIASHSEADKGKCNQKGFEQIQDPDLNPSMNADINAQLNCSPVVHDLKKDDVIKDVQHCKSDCKNATVDQLRGGNESPVMLTKDCSIPLQLPPDMHSSDRPPFGFFHNDKLFVFVPPSPEKKLEPAEHDSGTWTGKNKTGTKPSSRPLNLKSDQLMGTSKDLVQHIQNNTADIPVVIVRPKRKKLNKTESQIEDIKSEKMTPIPNSNIIVSSSGATKTINIKTDTSSNSHIVKTEDNNVQLKDCYIDLGTRKTIPKTVHLGSDRHHQEARSCPTTKSPIVSTSTASNKGKKSQEVKPTFVIANSNPDTKALPLLNADRTSLLADLLLFENHVKKEQQEPITVLLQTDKDKTLLVLPTNQKTKLDSSVSLVTKNRQQFCRDIRSDLPRRSMGNQQVRNLGNVDDTGALLGVGRNENVAKVNANLQEDRRAATYSKDVMGEGRETVYPVLKTKKGRRSYNQEIPGDIATGLKCNEEKSSRMIHQQSVQGRGCSLSQLLNLQPVSTSKSETGFQQDVPMDLFQGIRQLFYAAGAQISTVDGLTTLRRAVFTVCFTSQDPFLKSQTGVPGNLPVFIAYKDHMVSMIFTSHLCSGFFLVEPTGLVKEDPSRPDMYVESAYLLPYSHWLRLPQDAMSLVIGSLEGDWRPSLRVANALPQRSSPEDVVKHFLGLDDCRCFSTSAGPENPGIQRRSLSTPDLKRHRQVVEVLSCGCRDCGAYARSRRARGKRKHSGRVSVGSEEDSFTSIHTPEKESRSAAKEKSTAEKSVEPKTCSHEKHKEDFPPMDSGETSGTSNFVTAEQSRNLAPHVNVHTSHQQMMQVVPSTNLSPANTRSFSPAVRHCIYPYTDGVQRTFTCRSELETERNPVQMYASSVNGNQEVQKREFTSIVQRKQKSDKMIVKMGFPFKRTPK